MPISSNEGKSKIAEWLDDINPVYYNVLDIGTGKGLYSHMFRNSHTLQNSKWTGVEIWEPYVEQYNLHSKYDTLLIKDARRVDFGFNKYDVAFCGDILEHMTKKQAQDLVDKLRRCCRTVIVSIPIIHYEQGPIDDNPYEIHIKPDWSDEEVTNSFEGIVDSEKGNIIGVYKIEGLI